MPRHHDPKSRVLGAPVRIPKPLEDGKVRCNGCSAVMKPTPNGHLPRHMAPSGEPCAYRATYAAPTGIEAPAVALPPEPKPGGSIRLPDGTRRYVRSVVTGECHECGKPVPGERRFCGQCLRRRL